MTVRTQAHHPSTGAVIPSAGLEANFTELYDLQDGGIDSTNMDLTANFPWTGIHSFDTNLLYIDPTNNRIYSGATATTTIDSVDYQFQLTSLSAGTATTALISTATGNLGVSQATWHNSASPANGDDIWRHRIYGNDSGGNITEFARLTSESVDVTNGSEDGNFVVSVMKAGVLTATFYVESDQVQVRPESLVVGTTTNVGPEGFNLGLYVKQTDSNRRIALFENTDATASAAIFQIYKNSASPAASDTIALIGFYGNDDAGNITGYGDVRCTILDPTNGSEDGEVTIRAAVAGTGTEHIAFSGGTTAITGLATITSTTTTSDVCTITASSLTTGSALVVYSNSSSNSSRELVSIHNDNSSADSTVALYVQNDGNDEALYVVSDSNTRAVYFASTGVGTVLELDLDANSASDAVGLYIGVSNAGAGIAVGINFEGIGTDYFMSFASGTSGGALGAYQGYIPVLVGGTARKVPFYA